MFRSFRSSIVKFLIFFLSKRKIKKKLIYYKQGAIEIVEIGKDNLKA